MSPGPPSLDGLVGVPAAEARERLGDPAVERPAGSGRWMVWEGEGWRLRARAGEDGTIVSWSLAWAEGRPTLRTATEPLGLWPGAAPDAAADGLDAPLARRGLEDPGGGDGRSLTATVRGGRFVRVAVFDEPPEW